TLFVWTTNVLIRIQEFSILLILYRLVPGITASCYSLKNLVRKSIVNRMPCILGFRNTVVLIILNYAF
ncbi:hypothetical protein ACJX0J_040652, partial [Zea mays]